MNSREMNYSNETHSVDNALHGLNRSKLFKPPVLDFHGMNKFVFNNFGNRWYIEFSKEQTNN
jgi:hypothetical protein